MLRPPITLDLGTARNMAERNTPGNFIRAVKASGPDANITIYLDEPGGPVSTVLYDGDSFDGYDFRRLYFVNDAQAGESITLQIANTLPGD